MKLKQMIVLTMLTLSSAALVSCGTKVSNPDTPNPDSSDSTTDGGGDQTSTPDNGGDTNQGGTTDGNTNGDTSDGKTDGNTNGDTSDGKTDGNTNGDTSDGKTDGNTNDGKTDDSTINKKVDVNVDGAQSQSDKEGSVSTKGNLTINKVIGMQESLYITWAKTSYEYKVYASKDGGEYKLLTDNDYYIQSNDKTTRLDVFGLAKGNYNIKITASGTNNICNVDVMNYDRSGYAHFNYTKGVGAYNDDGTLKDNAVVIYVTDETKNTVTLTYKDKSVSGIGNILNSVGQKCSDAGYEDKCKKVSDGKTYYGAGNENDGIINYLAQNSVPLVVRFVGCVSESGLYESGTFAASSKGLIDGLTDYDSVDYGGSVGDNGHMARIKGGSNITLEGVGDDAVIDGWGFHFIAETNSEYGKNFEVRNLAFINTPEDAIGMEGQQSGSIITGSVEHCWVHHNSFFKPTISSPAESDKAEGDGSCDFKRGQYFTMSYNYFEYCHKTNLVGSSDTSLQYNLSYHHNLWYNCGSRIPLLRQANIHFYNNYILVSAGASVSYVTSLRANSYMYSECNYYEGCKQVYDGKNGGDAKGFGNTYLGIYNTDDVFEVDSREASVSSNCAYNGISYANFDTNSSLFYYDSVNKKSNCYLTSSTDARIDCLKYSGSRFRTSLNKASLSVLNTNSNQNSVDSAIEFSDGVYNATIGTNAPGIIYTSVKNNKFKGQGITFKLDKAASVKLEITSGTTNAFKAGYLVSSKGEVMLSGSGTCVLEAGVYYITSGQFDKESTVSSLTFEEYDSAELQTKQVEAYKEALANIGEVTYSNASYILIKDAMDKYNSLSAELKSTVDYATLEAKYEEYLSLGKTYVETLIGEIGEVSTTSGSAISAAREAYDALIEIDNTITISNYDVLTSAEEAYKNYAVSACIEAIGAIGEVSLDSLEAIETAESLYASLTDAQKALVTNYETLTSARSTYDNLEAIGEVNTLIESNPETLDDLEELYDAYNKLTDAQKANVNSKYNDLMITYVNLLIESIPESTSVTLADSKDISYASEVYNTLTEAQKASVTNYSKLEASLAALDELKNQRQVLTFDTGATGDNSFFTVSGNVSLKQKIASKTYEESTYTTALKMDSKPSITFTLAKQAKIIIIIGTDKSATTIKVNGTAVNINSDGVAEITLDSGSVSITKGDKESYIYAIIVE